MTTRPASGRKPHSQKLKLASGRRVLATQPTSARRTIATKPTGHVAKRRIQKGK